MSHLTSILSNTALSDDKIPSKPTLYTLYEFETFSSLSPDVETELFLSQGDLPEGVNRLGSLY